MKTGNDNADEVTRLRAEVERLTHRAAKAEGSRDMLIVAHQKQVRFASQNYDRWQAAEAALTGVRELVEEAMNAADMIDPWDVDRLLRRAALDPASPATPPSPAPADDEGISFEKILAAPVGQFDLRGDLLASIEAWTNAPSTTMSAPPADDEGTRPPKELP